jgi:hypothetical protein
MANKKIEKTDKKKLVTIVDSDLVQKMMISKIGSLACTGQIHLANHLLSIFVFES